MDLLLEMRKLKDYKIQFTTDDGEYEGVVKFITPTSKKITLDKVFILPQREPFSGTQNFFQHEIKSYTVIKGPKESPPKCENVEAKLDHSYMDKTENLEYRIDNQNEKEDLKEKEYSLVLPETLKDELPLESVIIDEINSSFSLAVKHIMQQSTVGVSFEGVCINRFGELCWIGISTSRCTFLFDILALQMKAFMNGLKDIFEDPKIQKVIHDCRQASDALHHLYSTKLVNVFDTQVADTFISLQHSKNGRIQENALPLDVCLSWHLSLSEEYICVQRIHRSDVKEALSVWKIRPLTNALQDVAIKNVIYLRLLMTDLLNKMLRSYTYGVDRYLQGIRNTSPQTLALEPSVPHLVPNSFFRAGFQMVELKEFTKNNSIRNSEKGTKQQDLKNPIESYLEYLENESKLFPESKESCEKVQLPPVSKSVPDANKTEISALPKSADSSKKTKHTSAVRINSNGSHSSGRLCRITIKEKSPEVKCPKINSGKLSKKITFVPAGMQ